MKTIRVKPWGADQGDYVVINESDFDPEVHTKISAAADKKAAAAEGGEVDTNDGSDSHDNPAEGDSARDKNDTGAGTSASFSKTSTTNVDNAPKVAGKSPTGKGDPKHAKAKG